MRKIATDIHASPFITVTADEMAECWASFYIYTLYKWCAWAQMASEP